MTFRLPRWSALRLRTKGLIVVTLPVLPLLCFWLLIGLALLREGNAPNTTSQTIQAGLAQAARANGSRQSGRTLLAIFLGGSVLCTAAGFGAALFLARGLSGRLDLLTADADALARGEAVRARPALGGDEIADLGAHLREAGRLLRQRDDEVRKTARSLDDFFNLSTDLFCIAGFDGFFKRLNPAWERTLGLSMPDLLVRPFVELIHPDDVTRTAAESAGLARGRETISFENRYRCADGSYRWLLWNARSSMEEGLIYASARDVTAPRLARIALDEATDALRRRTAELEAANRELEAFSYSVSHDLRAPLRAIAGFSQNVDEDYGDRLDAEGRDALRRIRAAATRMGTLIDELINLSRFTRMALRRDRVDLSALALGIVADLRAQAPDRDVSVDIGPGLAAVGDPTMLRVVLQNLLDNAWKYTGRTTAARIELGAVREEGRLVFFVRDNGAGFDNAYRARLFGAFERLHSPAEFEGTGIGLATVQRIVQRHGGRIWADGAVGAGATFSFTLELDSRGRDDQEPDDSAGRGQSGRRRADLAGVS